MQGSGQRVRLRESLVTPPPLQEGDSSVSSLETWPIHLPHLPLPHPYKHHLTSV